MKSFLWLAPAIALLAPGCAHTRPAGGGASAPSTPPMTYKAPPQAAVPVATCTVDRDCRAGDLCLNDRCTPITAELQECRSFRVHFDFDQAILHDQDKPSLERMARCLRADTMLRVTVEGNCDERGTEEYNLHLGDRRARAVAQYLEALGVSGDQLKTVSYGKDRPLCSEHDEACWAQNRRDELAPRLIASR